ncbi:MAG: hypothetical protein ACQESW_06555 [Bacteroidota bacterium]|jgi:hypothetical protein
MEGFARKNEDPTQELYYRFPSASEMFSYLHSNELSFQQGIVNPIEQVNNYQTTEAKLLNLGVYLADLTYLVVFKERQQAQEYLSTIQNLTRQLRIEPPFEEAFVQRMKKNVHRTDSLAALADEFNNRVMDYLMATGREKYLAIITTGGYIEALYLAANTLDSTNNEGIGVRLADQKYAVENLHNFVKQFNRDKTSLSEQTLATLSQFFNGLSVKKSRTKSFRDDEGKVIISGGEEIQITQQQISNFKKQIEEIRYHVVQTK